MKLLETIKPGDINTKGHFYNTLLQNCEKEVILRNLVINATKAGDWLPFTFKQYEDACGHEVTESEREELDELFELALLDKAEDGHYEFTDKFIKTIIDFVKA